MSDELPECKLHFEPPPMTVEFHFDKEVVGTLYFDEKPMRFEGDCDESARLFWDNILIRGETLKAENARLREERKKDCVDFFRWWWSQVGTDTEDGYDEWQALQENIDE
jgi:hypothetical protein